MVRDMNRKLILLLLAAVVLISCAADVPQQNANWTAVAEYVRVGVERVIDSEAGVICYVASGGGISCIPIAATRLKWSER